MKLSVAQRAYLAGIIDGEGSRGWCSRWHSSATHSPTRAHVGAPKFAPMPAEAVAAMERLHVELRSLKSNKRPHDIAS